MLVTDNGRLIRVPADQVRITARQAMGVTLLRLDAEERVATAFTVLEDPLEGPDSEPTETDALGAGALTEADDPIGQEEPTDSAPDPSSNPGLDDG